MERTVSTARLSSSEIKSYAKLAGDALDVRSNADYRSWISTSVKKFFPHDMFIAGIARQQARNASVDHLVSEGFPIGFIDAVTHRHGTFACPTLDSWFQRCEPQLFEPSTAAAQQAHTSDEFNSYDIKNVAAHGVLDSSSSSATYFSFSQIPDELNGHHGFLLELLIPHLDRMYLRILAESLATTSRLPSNLCTNTKNITPHITPRESAVLNELYQEQSNKTIARALKRSPDTIKHQIRSILLKLGASDRTEAVTTAIRLGLLPDRRQNRREHNTYLGI